jgi:hypothetical protein
MRPGTEGAGRRERGVTADVPFLVIGVLFWRGVAASSGLLVAFPFIHTNDMPIFCRFLEPFRVSPLPGNALRPAHPIDRVNH